MKKNLIILCIIVAALCYLQFGQRETVIASNIVHTKQGDERHLQIVANKLIIDKKRYEKDLEKKILKNKLNGVIFSGDTKNMNKIEVTVYVNRISYSLDQKFGFTIK